MSEDPLSDAQREAGAKMDAAVDHVRGEFAKLRTGRANPQLVADLPVEYYGTKTPLQQLAGISVPEPRMLVVSPYDHSALKEIDRALGGSDLGINPTNDGQVIRVIFPELSRERRQEYVKLARERAEDGRIGVRNARRAARGVIGKLSDDGEIAENEAGRAEAKLQEATDRHVARIDELLANKERELLEV